MLRSLLTLLVLACGGGALAEAAPASDSEAARERARSGYERFLALAATDDPRRASVQRRLADLQLELAEELIAEGSEPARAEAAYRRAAELYSAQLSQFPNDESNDAVLYQLARAQEALGQGDTAVATLAQLLADFPASGFLAESHFRRGEAYFSNGDFDLAAAAYGAIVESDDGPAVSPFHVQALYKLGWSRFRLGDYAEAGDAFLALLQRQVSTEAAAADNALANLPAGKRALVSDTLRAISLGFSYAPGVEAIAEALARQPAPGYEFLLYDALGEHYLEQERFSDAAEVFSAFVVDYPTARRAPALQLRVIETYRAAGFAEQELAAKEGFVRRYTLTNRGDYWARFQPAQSPLIVAALKLHMSELASHFHAQWQAGEQAGAALDKAVWYYTDFLASFPTDPDTPATHFLLGELQLSAKRYVAAVAAFEATAYRYGDHPRAAQAGYAAVLAHADQEALLSGEEQRAWQLSSINSMLRFAAAFPVHPEANNVQANAAERLFGLGEFAAAEAAARTLLAVVPPPAAPLQVTAWTVIGHSSFDAARYGVAEEAYSQLLALTLPDAERYDEYAGRLAASIYRQAEARRSAGDLPGAVTDFLRVPAGPAVAAIRSAAQFDAAAVLIELEQWQQAAAVLQDFRRAFPDNELASEATRKLSVVYLRDGQSVAAAGELMRLGADPNSLIAVRQDAVWQATGIYRDENDAAGEAAALAYIVASLAPALDEGVDARERLAALAAAEGNTASEESWLTSLVELHAETPAPSDRSRSAAALAALTLADRSLPVYASLELRLPLADSLQAKKSAMERSLADYAQVANYAVAETATAAAYRIAEIYREMARALLASDRPPELTELELEEYEFLLEEQAFPFEEKAIDIHEGNCARAAEGIFDEWVKSSFSALADMVPARYAKFEKGEAYARL